MRGEESMINNDNSKLTNVFSEQILKLSCYNFTKLKFYKLFLINKLIFIFNNNGVAKY